MDSNSDLLARVIRRETVLDHVVIIHPAGATAWRTLADRLAARLGRHTTVAADKTAAMITVT